MFQIKTYLELHSFDYTDQYFTHNPSAKYIDIEDKTNLITYVKNKDFSVEYIQMLVTVKYNDLHIVPIEELSGLNLWGDYINAVANYLNEGSCNIMYGIEPIRLIMTPKNRGELHFYIVDEFDSNDISSNAILPERDFLDNILEAAEYFWRTMEDVIGSDPCIDYWMERIIKLKVRIQENIYKS